MIDYRDSYALIDMIEDGLRAIDYDDPLIHRNYDFSDVLNSESKVVRIELAAHSQYPPSYTNAGFGVAICPAPYPEHIEPYRSLGAPQVFSISPGRDEIVRWKVLANGKPSKMEVIQPRHIRGIFLQRKPDWEPSAVLRAKSARYSGDPIQSDFYDLGLLTAIESVVHEKLDRLLRKVVDEGRSTFHEYHARSLNDEEEKQLYRLMFRFVAAKLLADRGFSGDWTNSDATHIIDQVNNFYFKDAAYEELLEDRHVWQRSWDIIRHGCQFQNLSVEALAYVYENTFVTDTTRRQLAVHATPPSIAEYMVNKLPIGDLDPEDRQVFEPFCGAAPFLVASLKRLRADRQGFSLVDRHNYFVRMLSGMEIDDFAREIAYYSLTLADYPNPAGWNVTTGNVFQSKTFDYYLDRANVVLCNPPFDLLNVEQRQATGIPHASQLAAAALYRVMKNPPRMLGFVLPFSFVDGNAFRELRKHISETYAVTSLVALPDRVFLYANQETVLLLAHGDPKSRHIRHSAIVTGSDKNRFLSNGHLTWESNASDGIQSVLWHAPLESIWSALDLLPKLHEVADVHRGLEYNNLDDEFQHVSDVPEEHFKAGIQTVKGFLEPFSVRKHQFLCTDPGRMRGNAFTLRWEAPKVIANAARISRGKWRIAAAPDATGLVCSQRLLGIWPTGKIPIEVLAAVLNSPIANAYLCTQWLSRDNQIRDIKEMPFPIFSAEQTQRLVTLVGDYDDRRNHGSDFVQTYFEIEKLVMDAYDLPDELRNALYDFFGQESRPFPIGAVSAPAAIKHFNYELPDDMLEQYHALLHLQSETGLSAEQEKIFYELGEALDKADSNTELEREIAKKARKEHAQTMAVLNDVLAQLRTL